jgi:3-methyladenine DNA glycosylase/8-oxoguanine DNA glycosylase
VRWIENQAGWTLQRPDVIRIDDLALRHAMQARYGLDHLPDAAEVASLADR